MSIVALDYQRRSVDSGGSQLCGGRQAQVGSLPLQLLSGGVNWDKLPDILIPVVNSVKNKP